MPRVRIAAYVAVALCCLAYARSQAAEHAAVTPVPKENAGWMERHESFNKRVAEGNVDLLLIGDSITHGWEGDGKEIWEKHYAPRHAVNLGIGGDRTQHVLWRLENGNVAGIAPKLAVVMIGTNNSGDNTSQEIADGVEAIVGSLREKLPETKVLVLAIFSRGANNEDGRRKVNEGANELIAKLADGETVHYLDINDAFLDDDGTLPVDVMPDLLHPNAKGYQIWAEAMEAKVAELMGE